MKNKSSFLSALVIVAVTVILFHALQPGTKGLEVQGFGWTVTTK